MGNYEAFFKGNDQKIKPEKIKKLAKIQSWYFKNPCRIIVKITMILL